MKKVYIVKVTMWTDPGNPAKSKVRFDLSDERAIEVPIKWYPRLEIATYKQRYNWRLIGKGQGIHWPDIDEDISLKNILDGKSSTKYRGN